MILHSQDRIDSYSLTDCKWQKKLNQIICPVKSNGKFPAAVNVHSPRTDKTVIYVFLTPNDSRFDQDGWDGEQMVYKTIEQTNNAEYLVLYNS